MDGLPSIHFSCTRDWRREVWKRSVREEKPLLRLELWLVSDLLFLLNWFFFNTVHQELFSSLCLLFSFVLLPIAPLQRAPGP